MKTAYLRFCLSLALFTASLLSSFAIGLNEKQTVYSQRTTTGTATGYVYTWLQSPSGLTYYDNTYRPGFATSDGYSSRDILINETGTWTRNVASANVGTPSKPDGIDSSSTFDVLAGSGGGDKAQDVTLSPMNSTVTLLPPTVDYPNGHVDVTFTASGGQSYVWSDNAAGKSGSQVTVTFTSMGVNKQVTVQAPAVTGYMESTPKTANVTVLGIAQAAVRIAPVNSSITTTQSLTFTAYDGSGTGDYTWGGSASGTGTSQLVNFPTAGTYYVTVYRKGSGPYNDSNTATATVVVTDGVTQNVSFSFGNLTQQYSGGTKTATVTPSIGGLVQGTDYTASLSGGPAVGSYQVSATAIGKYSGSGSATLTITKANQSTVSISPSSTSAYTDSAKSFDASGGDGTGGYNWSGEASGSGSSKSVIFSSAGTATVSVYRSGDENYNSSNTATATVTVTSVPDSYYDYFGITAPYYAYPGDKVPIVAETTTKGDMPQAWIQYQSWPSGYNTYGADANLVHTRVDVSGTQQRTTAIFNASTLGTYSFKSSVVLHGTTWNSSATVVVQNRPPTPPTVTLSANPPTFPWWPYDGITFTVNASCPDGIASTGVEVFNSDYTYSSITAMLSGYGTVTNSPSSVTQTGSISTYSVRSSTFPDPAKFRAYAVSTNGARSYSAVLTMPVAPPPPPTLNVRTDRNWAFVDDTYTFYLTGYSGRLYFSPGNVTAAINGTPYGMDGFNEGTPYLDAYRQVTANQVGENTITANAKIYWVGGSDYTHYVEANASTKVTVYQKDASKPPILSISVSPTTGAAPGATTVTWNAQNCVTANVSISGQSGTNTFSDTNNATNPGPFSGTRSFTGLAVGTYSFRLYGMGISGNDATQTATFTVTKGPQAAVTISPTTQTVNVGGKVDFVAAGGSGSGAYTWGSDATGTGMAQSVTFGTSGTRTVTVYRKGDTSYLDSNTATATITVNALVTAVQSLAPVVSHYTVNDSSSPANGKTYKRVWQEGTTWKAYLGRSGLRFQATGLGSNAVQSFELQTQEPSSATWATIATATPANGAANGPGVIVAGDFSVMLDTQTPGSPLVPLSYSQNTPKVGVWNFRARVQDSGGTWSSYTAAVPVTVELPIAVVSETLRTLPPAGSEGAWFTPSKPKTFHLPVWIP